LKSVPTFIAIFQYQFPLKNSLSDLQVQDSGLLGVKLLSWINACRRFEGKILIFLDPSLLTNTGVTFLRNAEKNKTAHRDCAKGLYRGTAHRDCTKTDGSGSGTERHREWEEKSIGQ
jgi:hypothetical protein